MFELANIINLIVTLCYLTILARIILGFVVPFMAQQGNQPPEILVKLYDVIFSVTEPVLAPIRRILPQTGMIDFSPLVVMIVLFVIQRVAFILLT